MHHADSTLRSRIGLQSSFALLGALSVVLTGGVSARAQAPTLPPAGAPTTNAPVTTGDPQTSPPEKNAEAGKATEFTDSGTTVASASLKLPAGAESVRQMTAPLGSGIDTVLINLYKMSGDLFADVFTSHKNQAWTKKNHIRLKSPLPIRAEKMTVLMRFLMPSERKGSLLIASDESADVVLVFPSGFGGKVSQQTFLTQSKTGARHTYTFGDQDSRGYSIVKASLDSAGEVKPGSDVQFYVWNGRMFIPRKAN
jgi:hypothetical protein